MKYIISKKRLLELLEKENKLNALECAGVDNWCGYYYALEMYSDGQDVDYYDMALEDLKNEFEYSTFEEYGDY